MFIKANGDAERLVFITTEGMEKKQRTDWILKSIGVNSEESVEDIRIIVSEWSISEIQNELSKYGIFDRSGEILVNITGGNKIMSLAAYEFFKEKSLQNQNNISMYYLNVGNDKFDMVFPSEQRNCVDSYHCNLKEYLTAYSIEQEKVGKIPLMEFEKTQEFYANTFETEKNAINALHAGLSEKNNSRFFNKHNKLPEELSNNQNISGLFQKTFGNSESNKATIHYLRGGWFEEYVYFLIKRGLKLNEKQIRLNLKIEDKSLSGKAVHNELDVIFIYKNKINIIECKTGLKSEGGGIILQEVLYKQSALKKSFGLTAKSFLFLPNVLSGNEEHKKRAEAFSIGIVDDKEMLLNEDRFKNEFLERFA
jgi:hypothetical protein